MSRIQDLRDLMAGFGKVRESEDPHKQAGGCGDIDCPICYTDDGSLKNKSGKFQQMGGGGGGFDLSGARPTGEPIETTNLKSETITYIRGEWDAIVPETKPARKRSVKYKPTKDDAPSSFWNARNEVEQYILSTSHSVAWDDVIGNDDAKAEIREAIEAGHKHKKLYDFYDKKPTKGVLLYGPPGNGKTMLGKAAAKALADIYKDDVEMLHISGPSIESPLVGVASRTVGALFNYAREYHSHFKHPLVIFMDEADALLKPRDWAPWAAELVGTFLSEMDGLEDSGAFIMLATNRPTHIDNAILRDGRIGRKIRVNRPDQELVKQIAAKNLAKKKWISGKIDVSVFDRMFDPELRLKEIVNPETGAKHFFNFSHIVSNAMVVGVIEDAKTIAFRRDLDEKKKTGTGVTTDDIVAAIEQKYVDNKSLEHLPALAEFIVDIALPAEAAAKELRGYK